MSQVTIWHNPRCSKSRQTLELLRSRGIEPQVVEYLKTPPSVTDILQTLVKLGMDAHDLMRQGEADYKEAGFSKATDAKALVKAMHEHPILIERPVVISGDAAAIGRPPEAVLDIL